MFVQDHGRRRITMLRLGPCNNDVKIISHTTDFDTAMMLEMAALPRLVP